jgi:pyruvate dehydrogenase E2 component (dihydrolipoamide acetyltransferase)
MPIEILMPALSPTMEEGTLAKWNVKEGDTVESGDVIAEIETDKATMEIESIDEGVVGKILVDEGSEGVKVNALIAVLLEEGEDASAMDAMSSGPAPASAPSEKGAPSVPDARDTSPAGGGGEASSVVSSPVHGGSGHAVAGGEGGVEGGSSRIKASPLAKRIAGDKNLDLSTIMGTGPHGRIVKRDVENAVAAPAGIAAAPSAPVEHDNPLAAHGISGERYDVIKADGITKISAKRLTDSFRDIPHFPLNVDCRLDRLLEFRGRLNAAAPEGVKVSVNDILIKACGVALKRVPRANASWIEDGRIALHKHADVSMAVAIEGGLITPIIKDADVKGLADISIETKDLARRARDRKLAPAEFQGGTFSLSNLGMMGIKSFASIINPPQGMIMSVGAGEKRPVVTDGELSVATVMTVTLTCDHRVVDGANGAQWLAAFKGFVEDPATMLM